MTHHPTYLIDTVVLALGAILGHRRRADRFSPDARNCRPNTAARCIRLNGSRRGEERGGAISLVFHVRKQKRSDGA